MHRWVIAVTAAMLLLAGTIVAQEASDYTPAENPFQGEFDFEVGAAVPLRVEVAGLRLESITLSAQRDVTPDGSIPCQVVISGSNAGERRAKVLAVLLLEDADSRGLQRISLEEFRVRSGRDFQEQQTMDVPGSALVGASKVYVFFQVSF